MVDAPVTHSELLEVAGLTVHFPVRSTGLRRSSDVIHAVDDVSFHIRTGETLGLVGESGSGKSTVGRVVVRRLVPDAGRIHFEGRDITASHGSKLRHMRRDFQMVFQDPYSSLSPRMRIGESIAEPIRAHRILEKEDDIRRRVVELLELCGLPEDASSRYPYAFSGGQRQRIGIARALAVQPKLIVADEPVSALDVSIQAQIINLFRDLQDRFGLSYLFISHNLAVVANIAHRVAIMYLGKFVEVGPAADVISSPRHPYTQVLLSAAPVPDVELQSQRRRIVVPGEPPSPIRPPSGCRFHTRCPIATEICHASEPPLEQKVAGHWAACWHT